MKKVVCSRFKIHLKATTKRKSQLMIGYWFKVICCIAWDSWEYQHMNWLLDVILGLLEVLLTIIVAGI